MNYFVTITLLQINFERWALVSINTQSMDEVYQLDTLISTNSNLAIVVISSVIDSSQSKMLLKMGVKRVFPKFYSTDEMILAFRYLF